MSKNRNVFPKTKIDAKNIKSTIAEFMKLPKTDKNFNILIKLLNLKYRGTIAKNPEKTKHYGKFSNKHTVVNFHTMIYFYYGKSTQDKVFMEIQKQNNNKEYGFYLTLKTQDNFNLHHQQKQLDVWNLSLDYYNNLQILSVEEHKNAHKED